VLLLLKCFFSKGGAWHKEHQLDFGNDLEYNTIRNISYEIYDMKGFWPRFYLAFSIHYIDSAFCIHCFTFF